MICTFITTSLALALATSAIAPVTYGPRPFFLVDDMSPSPLKTKLKECMGQTPATSLFSLGHRGAPVQFPEHTRESYLAAARSGAGIVECSLFAMKPFSSSHSSGLPPIFTNVSLCTCFAMQRRRDLY